MSVRFDRSEAPGTIRLEGDVDIGCAAELKALLEEALAARDGMQNRARIAVAAATGMDVTAVQLLWAAEREARAAGVVLELEGPVPEVLRTTLREAGFERFPFAPNAQDDAGGGAKRESQA
ncbi:MAG TPA: STAS domain-containing protein [Acidobacteriaceae bacterium]|nr:STAS domain-containing protein [Acidobacteriaceae bacterium]